MKKFVIYTNPHKDVNGSYTEYVKKLLEQKGAEVCDSCEKNAVILVLGGDGTMLQAMRELSSDGPYIGVNLGTLGFLTEIEKDGIDEALNQLIKDDYSLEKRMLLDGSVKYFSAAAEDAFLDDSDTDGNIRALNDVVLSRSGSLRILKFEIFVNGRPLHEYLADGMIISTPTGSTGYNLSAGGPIASPASEVIILTPICPHSLNQRSIILSGDDEVEIRIPRSRDGHLQEMEISFDGAAQRKVATGDKIIVRKSKRYLKFAKLGRDSFLDVLNRKMSEK